MKSAVPSPRGWLGVMISSPDITQEGMVGEGKEHQEASQHSQNILICELATDPSPFQRYPWIMSSCKGEQ